MAITPLPTPPSREDPNNFAERADALLAALVQFVTECNATASAINADESSAAASSTNASAKAGEAAAARDIALAAANYKGLWSGLAGSLNIPASVYHSGSIWMLTQNVASVTAEVPGVSSKWVNVSPGAGLGTAAYHSATDFQPAIGNISGVLAAVGGSVSAATAAQIVDALGNTPVEKAATADHAAVADSAEGLADGAVSAAAKIANRIITWAKMVNIGTARLVGRSSAGDGSPEEISIGSGLQLSGGVLACTVMPPVASVNGKTGAVQLSPADVGAAAAVHTHTYADLTAFVSATSVVINSNYYIRFTRANGSTVDVSTGAAVGGIGA